MQLNSLIMILEKVNLEKKLLIRQNDLFTQEQTLEEVKKILQQEQFYREDINSRVNNGSQKNSNSLNFDLLETDKIYHIDTIKSICVSYRLRFLDSKLFKNNIPEEAISKIRKLEKDHNTTIGGFKIMAPSKLFKLKNADDPLLYIPIGNNYYYLVHKWGNDINPFRKFLMLPFKNMSNAVLTLLVFSLLTTFLLPVSKFGSDNLGVVRFISFLFVFKSYCAILIYYCFWKGKNFSSEIWDSKFSN
jgi:hypothetical protein